MLDSLGRVLAALPSKVSECFCKLVGDLIYFGLPGRRHALLSNLHHAFPDKPRQWHRRIGRESCRRTVEMGLYVLASPAFSLKRLKRHFTLDEDLSHELDQALRNREGGVVMVPHFSLMESLTALPGLHEANGQPPLNVGVIFRPLNQPGLDHWVKRTRERFGLKLLSRKEGFGPAMQLIENNGIVAVLFDQNAGHKGVLTTFFGRVASTTDLPGLLAQRRKTRVGILYTERTGFWQGRIRAEILTCPPRAIDIMLAANQWLEDKLKTGGDDLCADWLWLHSRWGTQEDPDKRFRLRARRDAIEETLEYHGWDALPRKTRFWVRLPNWLGDVIMALPLLRALRLARPDAELTLLARPHFLPLLERFGVGDRLLPLPAKGRGYYRQFRRWREEYPDCHILFTNSTRGDLEARLIGAPQRFGIARPGKPRRCLNLTWPLPTGLDEATIHQTRLWEKFFQHFGLQQELDLSPFAWEASASAPAAGSKPDAPGVSFAHSEDTTATTANAPRIGLIPGTENSPEKRWPVDHWRTLVAALQDARPDAQVFTFGTERDAAITREVTKDFRPQSVIDRAGKTALVEFADELSRLDLLICNDTGGMHLANALGVPVLVVFGPTNPVRTGPIFTAPTRLVQPAGCPPTGGMSISQVHPDMVLRHALELLGSR
nr:glycosyltransferase family 9 protein [Ruficoccus amylovorans]